MTSMAPNFLLSLSLAPTTLKSYKQALKKLVAYLDEHPEYAPTNVERLDNLISAFTHHLYSLNPSRGNRQIAVNARCAAQYAYPASRGHLTTSEKAQTGWAKQVPPSQDT
jgi:hypothetical protein